MIQPRHPSLIVIAVGILVGIASAGEAVGQPPDGKQQPRFEGKNLDYWVKRLQSCEKVEDRRAAAKAIQAFGPDAAPAVPGLVEMLDDRSEDFRLLVGETLGALGPTAREAVPSLIQSLKGKTARTPEVVIKVLGQIGPDAKEAVPVLATALSDPKLRREALEALFAIGPAAKEAIPAMRRAIRDTVDESPFSGVVVQGWERLGEDAVPLILEFLDEKEPVSLFQSATALGKIGPPAKQTVPLLIRALKHSDRDVRIAAAQALWRIEKSTAGVPVLAELLHEDLKDRDTPQLVKSAATVLGEMGPAAKPALPALEKVLPGKYFGTAEVVKQAIRQIDPEWSEEKK